MKKYIHHIVAVVLVILCTFLLLSMNADASEPQPPHIQSKVDDLAKYQRRSAPLHRALDSAKQTVAELQAEVDYYDTQARTARDAICKEQEYCTPQNLDPANTGVNVDNYLNRL